MSLLAITAIASSVMLAASMSEFGEFNGKIPLNSSPDIHDLAVVFVDGKLVFSSQKEDATVGANTVQWLAPGKHELEVRPLTSTESKLPMQTLVINVESCMRYAFAAEVKGGGWEILATGEAQIADCADGHPK